jgi:hypothetical protein
MDVWVGEEELVALAIELLLCENFLDISRICQALNCSVDGIKPLRAKSDVIYLTNLDGFEALT